MAAEKITLTNQIRRVPTSQGSAKAVAAPLARQTFVQLPASAPGQAARVGGRVPAILARNARQTHIVT